MTQTILSQPNVVTVPTTNGKINHPLPKPFVLPRYTDNNDAAIGNGIEDDGSFDDVVEDEVAEETIVGDDGIDWDAIIDTTEEPVDPLITEPHYSLLSDPLYDSWSHPIWGKQFMVATNVGIFSAPEIPGIAPDAFFSLGVVRKADMSHKKDRSYYIWVLGKVPEVAIEIVSNTVGKEGTTKKKRYEELGILYYIIYDPGLYLQRKKRKANRTQQVLYIYKLNAEGHYVDYHDTWMPEVSLGVTRWLGTQKGVTREYLRWCDERGVPIPTGTEGREEQRLRAEQEHQRAEQEHQRAEQEQRQKEAALNELERYKALLRAKGIDLEQL